MRALAVLAVLLSATGHLASIARAEEETPFRKPPFSVAHVVPAAAEYPKGWMDQGGADARPVDVGKLRDIAGAAKIDAKALRIEARALRKEDGTTGLVAWVGIDAEARAFTKALADAVVENGWGVRELGGPNRLIVASGSSKEAAFELLDWATALAVRRICTRAADHVDAAARQRSETEYAKALRLAKAAEAIAPDSGIYNALRGMLAPPTRASEAVPFWRKALDEKAPIPAPIQWRVRAAAGLGMALLLEGSKEVLAEACRVLEFAAKHGDESPDTMTRFGAEYNLACAYARLGKLDQALRSLEASLKTGKEGLGVQYPQHYTHCKLLDSDMDPLRKDPRFDPLMEAYAPSK